MLFKQAKGQMGMLEYIMLTFITMVIIVALIFFLSTWQVTQLQVEKGKTIMGQAMALTKQASNSQYFVKSDSLFDDAKLTALVSRPDPCRDLEPVLGSGWFLEINVTGSAGDTHNDVECTPAGRTQSPYPDCGYWKLNCSGSVGGRFDAYIIPVNIYRNIGFVTASGIFSRTDIGTLTVGVYHD